MWQREMEARRQEAGLMLRSLRKQDLFVDPSKLKGGRNAILIHRDRFFRPILKETWEDDLEKHKLEPREFKFLHAYKELKPVSEVRLI